MITIFLHNFPYRATVEDLRRLFADFGPVLDLRLPPCRGTSINRGFAFVDLADRDTAERAILALDKSKLMGRTVHLKIAEVPLNRSGHEARKDQA